MPQHTAHPELMTLRAEITALRAEVTRLQASVTQSPTTGEAPTTRRRALARLGATVAGIAAVGASGIAALPVAATDGAALIVSQTNTSTGITSLSSSYNTGFGVFQVTTTGSRGEAIRGIGAGIGAGVAGVGQVNGVGVLGFINTTVTTGSGVVGTSPSATYGASEIPLPQTGTDNGVAGLSKAGVGVYGTSSNGIGVYGVHSDTTGSGSPYGVVGAVTGSGIGIYGVVGTAGAVAFAGGAGINGAIAAQFSGPVNIYHTGGTTNGNLYIQGNYTASGTKSAAVPHPDGSHRLLYCMESPEAWFEDFGEGTITAGTAEVKLDPDFVAVTDTGKLHIFLTPHSEYHTLHLTARTGSSFTVAAVPSSAGVAAGRKASDADGGFTWRVVAKRKDVTAERLARFDAPKAVKTPAVPLPKAASTVSAEPSGNSSDLRH